jgi:hypothetical protein
MFSNALVEGAVVAAVAALVLIGGQARARNQATKLERCPHLTRRDKIRLFIGFAAIAALSAYSLASRRG